MGTIYTAIKDLFFDKEYKATTNSNEPAKPPAQDFVMRPGQAPLQFSKGDLVMGIDEGSLSKYSTTNTDTTDASSNTMSTNSMLKVLLEQNSLLKELIAKVDQPVRMNINGKVMDEIEKQTTLRKTYNTKVDSGYGTFG
jgi:hypothetical protein